MKAPVVFRSAWWLPLTLVLVLLATLPAAAQVVRVNIDGAIHPLSAELIKRGVDAANARHADALLIELNTPGGLVDSTRDIIGKIETSQVPVIVFVGPSGARAASAGFYILESADVAAMADGTNTGAAHPVTATGDSGGEVMKAKMENDLAAYIRSYVTRRGRNVQEAERAVRESVAWTDKEALKLNLIDLTARDRDDLFKQLEGRSIKRFDGSSTVLHLAGKPVEDLPLTIRERLLWWLMDPNVAFLVLAVGALAIYAEFNHPGVFVPGVVGVALILLTLFALFMLPTRSAALWLILLAFVLFALEAKMTTHGLLTTGGIVALTLGGLFLVNGPIPEMRVKLVVALAVSLPFGLITAFLMSIAWRARRNKVSTGEQGLVGEVGVARTDLAPEGKVFVHGEIWNARAKQPIQTGEAVRVVSISQLDLVVERAPQAAPVP